MKAALVGRTLVSSLCPTLPVTPHSAPIPMLQQSKASEAEAAPILQTAELVRLFSLQVCEKVCCCFVDSMLVYEPQLAVLNEDT